MKMREMIDKQETLEAAKKLDSYAWTDFASVVERLQVFRIPKDGIPEMPGYYETAAVLGSKPRLIDAAAFKEKLLSAPISPASRRIVYNLLDAQPTIEAEPHDSVPLDKD